MTMPSIFFDAVDVGLSVNEPAVLTDAHDRGFFVLVELVVEVAHQLFEDVATRNDAGHAAVLVEHQREGSTLGAHLTETLEQVEGLGQHEWTANLASDLFGRGQRDADRPFDGRAPKEVVDEEHAQDVVEVVTHDGKTRVAGVAHRLGDRLGRDRKD
jgi:hypothetical protein